MGIGSIGLRLLRNYKQLVFNPHYSENITKSMRVAMRKNEKAGISKYSNFMKMTKDGIKYAEKKTANTSIRQGIKNGLGLFKKAWVSNKGFLGKSKGLLKALGKNVPLLFSALLVIPIISNTVSAVKDKGLIAGVGELLKGTGQLGTGLTASAVGAAVGSAFLPPIGSFVGGVVGWMAGDWLFSRIFGKSYNEKKMEEAQLLAQQQAAVQEQVGQILSSPQFAGLYNMNNAQGTVNASVQQQTYNPYASMATNLQLMQMQNQLYSGKSSYADDIMFNQVVKNGFNMMG